MNSVKSDFQKRKDEIEEYFSFVSVLTKDVRDSKLIYNSLSEEKSNDLIISDQLQKILIANGFLLLYNLIEATIRNSICEIYFTVYNNDVDYKELSENLKNIWISQQSSNLKGNYKSETLHNTISTIANSILNKEIIELDKEKLDFSGNLDAKKIRGLATKYGFIPTSINGENLLTIKNKRNHLAHGDFSFSEIGKDFSIGDLIIFKTETFLFLTDVVLQIENFIRDRKFLYSMNNPLLEV